MTKQELVEYYKSKFNKEISGATLSRWIKEGKLKASKLKNNTYDYDLESFENIINSEEYLKRVKATKEKPQDYIDKIVNDLQILSIVPKEEYQTPNYLGTLMYCKCLRCNSITQVRFTYLTPNGNYEQISCGCARKERAFLASSRQGLTSEMLKPFRDDFDKFLVVHKILKANTEKYYSNCPIEEYLNALTKIYHDNQFNSIYNFWKKQDKKTTFYDWAKPSLDHIIPKSRGGTHKIDNLQILTVFENLAKRDMT